MKQVETDNLLYSASKEKFVNDAFQMISFLRKIIIEGKKEVYLSRENDVIYYGIYEDNEVKTKSEIAMSNDSDFELLVGLISIEFDNVTINGNSVINAGMFLNITILGKVLVLVSSNSLTDNKWFSNFQNNKVKSINSK